MKNFIKSSLALAAISVASLAAVNPANALSLTFKPTGSAYLDSDAIRDLEVTPGGTVAFDIFLETFGLADDEQLSAIDYTVTWEGTELMSAGSGSTLFPSSSASYSLSGASIAPDQFNLPVATLNFVVGNVLSNDGMADFTLSLDNALDQFGNPFSSLTATETQILEVQAEAIPTPALLPGLLGMGAAFVRKRRAASEQSA